MAALLGLEETAGFEDAAKRQADDHGKVATRARDDYTAAESRLRASERELSRLEQRIATEPGIIQIRQQLESLLAETAVSFAIRQLPTQARDAVSLGQVARRLRRPPMVCFRATSNSAPERQTYPPSRQPS